jgi:hypothetical protein
MGRCIALADFTSEIWTDCPWLVVPTALARGVEIAAKLEDRVDVTGLVPALTAPAASR